MVSSFNGFKGKLFIDLKGQEYLTQLKAINEAIIEKAFLTINYHILFIREELSKAGVIFSSISEAINEYPEAIVTELTVTDELAVG